MARRSQEATLDRRVRILVILMVGSAAAANLSSRAETVVPPVPSPPERFAADASDPAGRAARLMARRIQTFRNYRAAIADATWVVDETARWSVRSVADCHASLGAAGVPFQALPSISAIVAAPVRIQGEVHGIRLRGVRIACELAARLPTLLEVLRRNGVRAMRVMSDYRDHPRPSFHTMGLALDLSGFTLEDGTDLSVQRDFETTLGAETCLAPPPVQARARRLLAIACDLHATRVFASVLTPNYNAGHRDHFHIDARPDDPRLFIR